jgi:hypothetical protein
MVQPKYKEKEVVVVTQRDDSSEQVKVKGDPKEMERLTQPLNIE